MEASELPEQLQQVRAHADSLGGLFDLMERNYLFVKDLDHRFCRCNRALWSELGLKSESEMLGNTDADYFPPSLAKDYVDHDLRVIKSGKPILGEIWLVPSQNSLRWYKINKFPIFGESEGKGKLVIGVAGLMVPYEGAGSVPPEYERIKPSLVLANRHSGAGISVKSMAAASGYSMNQFTRVFRFLFHMKPQDYLLRLRLGKSARLLRSSDKPIIEIATLCGFYDQSAFTKAFRRHNGLTPRNYRKQLFPS